MALQEMLDTHLLQKAAPIRGRKTRVILAVVQVQQLLTMEWISCMWWEMPCWFQSGTTTHPTGWFDPSPSIIHVEENVRTVTYLSVEHRAMHRRSVMRGTFVVSILAFLLYCTSMPRTGKAFSHSF
jgi:hypothetical protein